MIGIDRKLEKQEERKYQCEIEFKNYKNLKKEVKKLKMNYQLLIPLNYFLLRFLGKEKLNFH